MGKHIAQIVKSQKEGKTNWREAIRKRQNGEIEN